MKKLKSVVTGAVSLMAIATLVACAPKTAEKAKSKLEDKGYEVVALYSTDTLGSMALDGVEKTLSVGNLESMVTATKTVDSKVEGVIAFYFEKASDAKEAMNSIEENYKKVADEDHEEFVETKRSGKVIYMATEQGAKDFK